MSRNPESVRRGTPKISVKNDKIIPKKKEKNPENSAGLRWVLVGGSKKWPMYDCTFVYTLFASWKGERGGGGRV
jgi:hypothetical protein